jgi:putative PIG3 family NAD(P)H quinone oxidoreductase
LQGFVKMPTKGADPKYMTAIAITEPGGPLVLKPEKRPLPEPGNGEIVIRVRAAGINRPDILQRMGAYPPPPDASDLPGLEVAGEVAIAGPGTQRFKPGDLVAALTPGGGYAEYCKVHETNALPVPHGLTFTQAAALPETFFTVWHNVFQRGALREGEAFLVHGGTSGIGTTAIQIAKIFGATVMTTAGSEEKCKACLDLGADLAINYREQDFVGAVKKFTGGKGANVILDMVGGDYVGRNYDCAAMEGRIVQIAVLQGARATADISKLMIKRLLHTGSTLRPRSIEFKAAIARELEQSVWPLLSEGRIAPVMDMIFPLSEAWRAHERMEEGAHIGKIVLDVN